MRPATLLLFTTVRVRRTNQMPSNSLRARCALRQMTANPSVSCTRASLRLRVEWPNIGQNFFVDLDLLPRPHARGLLALFRRDEIGDIPVVRKRRIAWPCGIGGGQSHRDQPHCEYQTDCGIRIEPAIECATVFCGQGVVAPSNVVRDHGSSPVAAEH